MENRAPVKVPREKRRKRKRKRRTEEKNEKRTILGSLSDRAILTRHPVLIETVRMADNGAVVRTVEERLGLGKRSGKKRRKRNEGKRVAIISRAFNGQRRERTGRSKKKRYVLHYETFTP